MSFGHAPIDWVSRDARLREGAAKLEPRATTAAALGVTVAQLHNRLRALGLTTPRNGTIRKPPLTYRPAGRDRTTGCQHIAGDPKTSPKCGGPRRPGSPYCEDHHAMCHDNSRSYRRL